MSETRTLKLPETLSEEGLLVGWSLEHLQAPMPLGFNFGNPECCPDTGFLDAIMFENRGNILTFSGQRSASDANCLVPAMLRHPGSVISLSGSACTYRATAKARKARGDTVVLLDPYGLCSQTAATFNPFSLLDKNRDDLQEKARALARLICPVQATDPNTAAVSSRAQQFLAAVLLFQVLQEPPVQHTLERTRAILFDRPQDLKRLLDLLSGSPADEVRQAASFLSLTPPEILTAMLSYLQDQLVFLNHQGVVEATRSTSFDLDDLVRGVPTAVFIVLPGLQSAAYERLGQLWIGTLLEALARRMKAPPEGTLVLLDQAQDLGGFEALLLANNHLGAFGVHLWTIWADAEALRSTYPQAWRRFLSEAWVLQVFGTNTMIMAQEMAALTGYPSPGDIMDLDHDEMILVLAGDNPVIAQRVNGYTDPVFARDIDQAASAEDPGNIMLPKKRSQRRFVRQEPVPHLPYMSQSQLSHLLALGETAKRSDAD
ncbi:MAG: type IV secretory system conjugative DNA transfer family protein [Pseudomonadota bacterium]